MQAYLYFQWMGTFQYIKLPGNSCVQNANNEIHFIVEPNIEGHNVFKLTDYKTAVAEADIIALLVAHDEFKSIEINSDKVVLDFCAMTYS